LKSPVVKGKSDYDGEIMCKLPTTVLERASTSTQRYNGNHIRWGDLMADRYEREIQRLQEEIERLRINNYITKQEFDSYRESTEDVIFTDRYGLMKIEHFFDNGFAAYPIRKDGQRFKGAAGSLKYFYVNTDNSISSLKAKLEQLRVEQRERNKRKYVSYKERLRERAHKLLLLEREKNNGIVPRPPKRPLILSYELTWRTDNKKSIGSTKWKILRLAILERDDYTCVFCGYASPNDTKQLQVNHVDGNPNNNDFSNLETVCGYCHFIIHSGFSACVFNLVEIYEHSDVKQEEIIRITRELRSKGHNDDYIKEQCGLRNQVPWVQDHQYLSTKYGFVSSRKVLPTT
jgi:5-methylcytosine-specific restriction endonuclease McrA